MEKFKIVSDESGATCEVFIDGKEVERVLEVNIHPTFDRNRLGLILELIRNKTDEKGNIVLNEDRTEIVRELEYHDFSSHFSEFMNPPEDN